MAYDYFTSLNTKLHDYIIPKELLLRCKHAHSRYREAHAKLKSDDLKGEKENKRTHLEDEIADVKRQKQSIDRTINSLKVDVDNFLTIAEEKNDMSYLVKANAFRKSVKEKNELLKDPQKAEEKLEDEKKKL